MVESIQFESYLQICSFSFSSNGGGQFFSSLCIWNFCFYDTIATIECGTTYTSFYTSHIFLGNTTNLLYDSQNFPNIFVPIPSSILAMGSNLIQPIGYGTFTPIFSQPIDHVPHMGMVTSRNMWGGSSVSTSHPKGKVDFSISQAWYNSLFRGMLSSSTFLGGASLPGGNPSISTRLFSIILLMLVLLFKLSLIFLSSTTLCWLL